MKKIAKILIAQATKCCKGTLSNFYYILCIRTVWQKNFTWNLILRFYGWRQNCKIKIRQILHHSALLLAEVLFVRE